MTIFDYQLFFGFPVCPDFQAHLNQVPSEVQSLFIQDHPDYLSRLEYQNSTYLGKYVGSLADASTLELVEAHLYSLLRRLVTDYPYEQKPLILLAVQIPETTSY